MKSSGPPNQTSNIVAASIGALIGLSALAWTLHHETVIALLAVAILIPLLGHFRPRGARAMLLCGVLGLACARLTISLIQ